MMSVNAGLTEIYLCVSPVDMRKQIAGLSALVQDELKLNPFDAKLFGFTNRQRTICRLLYWDHSGFALWTKKLERERFHWPKSTGETVQLDSRELQWLIEGFDLSHWRPHARLAYEWVA